MPLVETDKFTPKLYRVRDSYHARLLKRARDKGVNLQDVVNEAFKNYLDGAKPTPDKVKPSAKTKK